MVTTFADAPFTSPELETLLLDGGRYTWAVGPLAKGSNLCHALAATAMRFSSSIGETGDAVWLERARAFAMTGIRAMPRGARGVRARSLHAVDWRHRLAIYLWDCLTGVPRFPTVDVF